MSLSSEFLVVLCVVFYCYRYYCVVSSSTGRLDSGSRQRQGSEILIRIAVFVDRPLVGHLEDNLELRSTEDKEIFLHSYVAQMDLLFAQLSSESISRIHLELAQIRYEDEAGQFTGNSISSSIDLIMSSFCLYQESANRNNNNNNKRWDFALLLTPRDIYDEEEKSAEEASSLLGISPVAGIQWPDLSCGVVELGTGFNEIQTKPTRGMSSAWVAAHELGHNLGLHHDGQPFNGHCDDSQFMMARYSLELDAPIPRHQWSSCSSRQLDNLDLKNFKLEKNDYHHRRSRVPPGRMLDADLQCKIFGIDRALHRAIDCAGALMCSTQDNISVPIGPALEGTRCDHRSEDFHCIAGSCVDRRLARQD